MPDIRHIKTMPTGSGKVVIETGRIKPSISDAEILRLVRQEWSYRRPRFFWRLLVRLLAVKEFQDLVLDSARSELKK